uniref:leucine-rich repeat protein n=1 Tax=Eubacterium cellulosolvens TaxID=29322 RepID=UPI00192E5482
MRKRILVLLTAAALAVSSFPIGVFAGTDINTGVIREADDISATVTDEELVGTQSRTDHFAGGYTITGDGAKDILSVAEQQEGRREADFGYSEAWCANFVSDCALIAGQDKAVPADGLCKSLRDNIINAGGRVVSKAKAKAGDIVFYDWVDKNSTADADPVDFYEHVEICYANSNGIVCTIGGNTSGGKVGRHNIRSTTDRILEIVRPNYTNNQSPVATATPRPTATSTPTPPQLPSGDCSATSEDNVKWKVVKGENNKLKLIISGTGRICDSNMDNPLFNRIHKELCGLSGYENEMISEIEIDEGVTGIGDNAFNSWRSNPYEIEQVSLPNSLLEIGNNAFDFCFNLQEIKIPKNVNFIGYGAFSECRSLKEIIIPKGITSISSLAFEGCSSLQEITIPQSVTYIDSGAFEECSSLQEITLPQSVTYIGSSAFEGCSSLQEITIPQNVTYIGERAFLNCDNIQKIVIPNGVTSIEESTFCGCSSIQEIKIPTSVTSIEKYAFIGCSSIQEIKIPTSVTSIGKDAFMDCSSLQKL